MNKAFEKDQGFSLLEMIIAITVFMILMASVFGIFKLGLLTKNSINDRSEVLTNARLTLNYIGNDIVNAGIGFSKTGAIVPDGFLSQWSITNQNGTERDLLTSIVVGNKSSPSIDPETNENNDAIFIASKDIGFNKNVTLSAYIQQNVDSPDDLELLAYNCVDCHPFDLYLLQGIDGKQAIAMLTKIQDNPNYQNYKDLFFQVNDPLNVNRSISLKDKKLRSILTPCNYPETADCFVNSQILISKINLISYQLDVNGNLIKTTYGNNSNGSRDEQVKKQILTQDIKSFQLKYLLRDGTRTDDPTEGNLPAKANQIVQVEVAIKLKTDNNNLSQEESSLRLFSTFSARNLKYDLSD